MSTAKTVYSAIFESHLRHCLMAYGAAFPTTLGAIENIQNSCVRKIVLANARGSIEPLYQRAKILTLKQLYLQGMLFTFHIKDNVRQESLLSTHRPTHSYNTRRGNSHNIMPPRVRLERTKRLHTHRYLQAYNILPAFIREMRDERISTKKKAIREFVFGLTFTQLARLMA